jgi:hypothetical protein
VKLGGYRGLAVFPALQRDAVNAVEKRPVQRLCGINAAVAVRTGRIGWTGMKYRLVANRHLRFRFYVCWQAVHHHSVGRVTRYLMDYHKNPGVKRYFS